MIAFKELVKQQGLPSIDAMVNLYRLQFCLNSIRILYDCPMGITSGFRTSEEHYRIYQTINAARKSQGKPPVQIPSKSWHLFGGAADVGDPDHSLKDWIIKNLSICEDLNLYFEDFSYCPTWCHIQIYPPRSGERFFKPY